MFHGIKYLNVSLVFSHLGFWSGNLFLIAPFPDLCLLVPFYDGPDLKLFILVGWDRSFCGLISKYNVGLRTLLSEGLSEPEFYGDLVYKFKKLKVINGFSFRFGRVVARCRRVGCSLNVVRRSACLVFGPVMVGGCAAFFGCVPVGRASDSVMAPT